MVKIKPLTASPSWLHQMAPIQPHYWAVASHSRMLSSRLEMMALLGTIAFVNPEAAALKAAHEEDYQP
jgi:hypothetical protein